MKRAFLALLLACDAATADRVEKRDDKAAKADAPKGEAQSTGGAESSSSSGTSSGTVETTGISGSETGDDDAGSVVHVNVEPAPTMRKLKKKRPTSSSKKDPYWDSYGGSAEIQQRAIEHDLVSVDKKLDDMLKGLEQKG